MRRICAERDRLWAEYDQALRAYIRAVNQMATFDTDTEATLEHTRATVDEARDAIRRHCRQCGCDPDCIRAFFDRNTPE